MVGRTRLSPAGSCVAGGVLRSGDEVRGWDAKAVGERQDARQRQVVFPALDSADVVAVQVGALGERLLRQAKGGPMAPDRGTERGVSVGERRHGRHAADLTSRALHTTTVIQETLDSEEPVMDDRDHQDAPSGKRLPALRGAVGRRSVRRTSPRHEVER